MSVFLAAEKKTPKGVKFPILIASYIFVRNRYLIHYNRRIEPEEGIHRVVISNHASELRRRRVRVPSATYSIKRGKSGIIKRAIEKALPEGMSKYAE